MPLLRRPLLLYGLRSIRRSNVPQRRRQRGHSDGSMAAGSVSKPTNRRTLCCVFARTDPLGSGSLRQETSFGSAAARHVQLDPTGRTPAAFRDRRKPAGHATKHFSESKSRRNKTMVNVTEVGDFVEKAPIKVRIKTWKLPTRCLVNVIIKSLKHVKTANNTCLTKPQTLSKMHIRALHC